MPITPILISIPHGGWKVADEIKDIWQLSPADALHDGDPFTSRIYDFSDRAASQIVMEYFRAVVDLNRRPDDCAPENPDGVIKSHTCFNVEVYRPGTLPGGELKETMLRQYYYPYHEMLDRELARGGIKLGVDCHSMAAVAPPIEKNAGEARPLICLGNLGDALGNVCEPFNRITCSPDLLSFMAEEFNRVFKHEDVEIDVPAVASRNIPFSGGYITQRVGDGPVPFVQIEMSRALYITDRYFNSQTLELDEKRIQDLNKKIWSVLEKTVKNLES